MVKGSDCCVVGQRDGELEPPASIWGQCRRVAASEKHATLRTGAAIGTLESRILAMNHDICVSKVASGETRSKLRVVSNQPILGESQPTTEERKVHTTPEIGGHARCRNDRNAGDEG